MLEDLASSLRDYAGTSRKHAIREIVGAFDPEGANASFREDAAVLDCGDNYHKEECLLLAADGIWDLLMRADPEWSGYCAVLANVHDIYAMGGRPVAMVDVFSTCSDDITAKVLRGMRAGIDKFGVPVVGGHTHPDTTYAALDVAILGRARKDSVIYSSKAHPGDDIVLAIDLDGRVHPSCGLNWDSTFEKGAALVRRQAESMVELGERKLLTAGKDVSNPGIIGTLGMVLEASGAGAEVAITKIPKPPALEYQQWLRMYPGMGFIATCRPENTGAVLETYERHGLTVAKIGAVTPTRRLDLTDGPDRATVFDFTADAITGLEPVRR